MIKFKLGSTAPGRESVRPAGRRKGNKARLSAILIAGFLVLVSVYMFSCIRLSSRPGLVRVSDRIAGADSLELKVEMLLWLDEIEDIFNSPLPRHGILPVKVTFMNRSIRNVVLYPGGMQQTGWQGSSFLITVNGDTCRPVHPAEVYMRIKGLDEPVEYRDFSLLGSMFKSFVAPMMIGYYGYREFSEGRYYGPLMEESFYPALSGGMFEPVTVSAGGERAGFLYLSIPSQVRSILNKRVYPEEDKRKKPPPDSMEAGKPDGRGIDIDAIPGFTFKLYGCYEQPIYHSLPWKEVELVCRGTDERRELMAVSGRDGHNRSRREIPCGFFVLKHAGGSGDGAGLYYGEGIDSAVRGEGDLYPVTPVRSGSACLAGAVYAGENAVCAVNFRSGCHLWILNIRGGRVAGKHKQELRRKTERLLVIGQVILAVAENDFCHLVPVSEEGKVSSFKLGYHVDDVALMGESLFIFGEEGGVKIADPAGAAERTDFDLSAAPRRVAGNCSGFIVLITGASRGISEKLTLFNPHSLKEITHFPLPGKAVFSGCRGSSVYLQLAGRSLVRLDVNSEGMVSPVDSGVLPFTISDLGIGRDDFIAFGPEGQFVQGDFAGFHSCLTEEPDFSLKVVVPPATP